MCSDAACLGVPLLQQPLRYRSREDRRTQGLELLGWKDGNQGGTAKISDDFSPETGRWVRRKVLPSGACLVGWGA